MARLLVAAVAALCVAVALAQTVPMAPHRQYAVSVYGVDLIDFNTPALAYISDLRYDSAENVSNPRIWFLADKASPNIFYAQFNPTGATLARLCRSLRLPSFAHSLVPLRAPSSPRLFIV